MTVPHRIPLHPRFRALRTRTLAVILVPLVIVLGTPRVLASPKDAAGDPSGGDWVYADHDLAGTRYSHLKQTALEVCRTWGLSRASSGYTTTSLLRLAVGIPRLRSSASPENEPAEEFDGRSQKEPVDPQPGLDSRTSA
jgi:hypothetical protein